MIDRRSLISNGLGLAVGSGGLVAAGAATQAAAPQHRPRRIDLRIRFMTTRDGRTFERGRETVSYDFHDDGRIAYHVSSHSDDPRIARDCLYTLDSRYRPLEAFVRLQVDGRYEGSGWFRFDGDQVTSETFNAAKGRNSLVTKLDSPARAFVAHPVSTDVMLVAAYERGGPRRQRLASVFTSSVDSYGRVGPSLSPSRAYLEYVGQETIATPAGMMLTDRHELYTEENATEPLESMWTQPGTCLFVRARAGGPYNTVYELVDYRAG